MSADRTKGLWFWVEKKGLGKQAQSVVNSTEKRKEITTDGSKQIINYYARH